MKDLVISDDGEPIASILESNQAVTDNEFKFGDYAPGRYSWIFEDVELIKTIPAKGQLSLWNFDLESA